MATKANIDAFLPLTHVVLLFAKSKSGRVGINNETGKCLTGLGVLAATDELDMGTTDSACMVNGTCR